MQYPKYSKDTIRYDLGRGYTLERAAGVEFAAHYVAYRDADVRLHASA